MNKNYITLRFCFAGFCMDSASAMFMVAMPFLALSLQAEPLHLGIIGALRGLAYVIAALPAAILSDRLDRRALVAFVTGSVVIVFLASSAATTLWQLYLAIILYAVLYSPFWPTYYGWLGETQTTDKLASSSGAVNFAWSIGGMTGGFLAGWLFPIRSFLPFFCAAIPALLACSTLLLLPKPKTIEANHTSAKPLAGTRRELASGWIGSFSSCCLHGLLQFVFPALGKEIGIDSRIFGILIAGTGLGRSLIFLIGTRWGDRLHDWRLSVSVQVASAALFGTIFFVRSLPWLAFVFIAIGINLGISYYRGLYKSIEGEGSRGLKAGINEAAWVGGSLCGSLGGGIIAQAFGVHAPYLAVAPVILLLALIQVLLVRSANRARLSSIAYAPKPAGD